MSDDSLNHRLNLRSATETSVQTYRLTGREITVALRDTERYCTQQISCSFHTLNKELENRFRAILAEPFYSTRERVSTTFCVSFGAVQPQTNCRVDEQIYAMSLQLEHIKG